MSLKNTQYGNIIIDIQIVLCFLAIVLTAGFMISTSIHEKTIEKIEAKQELFTNEYIVKNPLMIPVINAYKECQNKSYKVVEGCIAYTTKNAQEKQKLENYLYSLEVIY